MAEKLMLKDKEVISDPQTQEDIAKQIHMQSHGGINKVTAMIATKYHWVRIKETVSHVIKNCPQCKDSNKVGMIRSDSTRQSRHQSQDESNTTPQAKEHILTQPLNGITPSPPPTQQQQIDEHLPSDNLTPRQQQQTASLHQNHLDPTQISPHDFNIPHHLTHQTNPALHDPTALDYDDDEMSIDPQIIEQLQAQLASETYPHSHHENIFSQPSGLPQYVDASQLQHHPHHHHQDTHDFNPSPQDHHRFSTSDRDQFATNDQPQFPQDGSGQFVHDPGTSMIAGGPHHDHQMMGGDDVDEEGDGGTGLNSMQGLQRGLQLMDYMRRDGTYKQ